MKKILKRVSRVILNNMMELNDQMETGRYVVDLSKKYDFLYIIFDFANPNDVIIKEFDNLTDFLDFVEEEGYIYYD